MTTTLAQLRTRAQSESDNINQQFVANSEWLDYINASYQELYGLITESFGNDYFVQSPSSGYQFVTDGVNDHFALPADFYKLLGVDLLVSAPNYWVSLKSFPFSERNKLGITNTLVPMAGQTVRLLYIPRAITLVNDTDTIDGVNGWEEYIVVDAAMKAIDKEESDSSGLAARKQALLARLTSEIENRDASSSGVTADVYGRRARAMQYRLNGPNIWLIGNGMPGWGPFGDWGNSGDYGWGW